MTHVKLDEGLIQGESVAGILDSAMDADDGLLRLTPTWAGSGVAEGSWGTLMA